MTDQQTQTETEVTEDGCLDLGQQDGAVKWFNKDKGYGFINIEDETRDIFVHFSEIQVDGFKTLVEGSKVSFKLVENQKGLVAKKVEILEVPAPPPVSYQFPTAGDGASPGAGFRNHYSAPVSPSRPPSGRSAAAQDGGDYLNVQCSRNNCMVSLQRQGNRKKLVLETSGGPGLQVLERLWRNLMQFEGIGADNAQSLRTWLKMYRAFSGHAYNTQGQVPAWIGSEQARDELRVEGLVR